MSILIPVLTLANIKSEAKPRKYRERFEMQSPVKHDKFGKRIGLNKKNNYMQVPNGTGPGARTSEFVGMPNLSQMLYGNLS